MAPLMDGGIRMRPEWARRCAGGRRLVWVALLLLVGVALSGCVRLPWSHAPAPEEELATYPTRTEAEFVKAYGLVPPIAGATELSREVQPYSFRVRLSAPGSVEADYAPLLEAAGWNLAGAAPEIGYIIWTRDDWKLNLRWSDTVEFLLIPTTQGGLPAEYQALPLPDDAREVSHRVTENCVVGVYEAGLLNGAKLRTEMEQRGWVFKGGAGELVQLTFSQSGRQVLVTQGIQDEKLRVSLCITNNSSESGLATPDHPAASPSGKFRLEVREETLEKTRHWRFTITGGEKPFTPDEAYRTRDALFILWDEHDRVWVYSGDVGTFIWEQAGDRAWQKHAYADRPDTPVPALLQQLRPRQFH